jgi:hypothetical protein
MPRVEITKRFPVDDANVAALGYDPESSTLEIDWRERDVFPAERRRYRAVPSFAFAKILVADDVAREAAIQLRSAMGVVVE